MSVSVSSMSRKHSKSSRSIADYSLQVTPSTLEVDYDKNLTALYKAITDQNWARAERICSNHPIQAATWVVRHYNDDHNENEEKEIMWRFLPLHSATARQPPASVIAALLKAYPDAAACVDDQGMYALHYACGNQASAPVIRQLLAAYSGAAKKADPRGMLPLHYLACWGPSEVSIVDMLLAASRDVALTRDDDGNTPLDLALSGEYPEKNAVVAALQKWTVVNKSASAGSGGSHRRTNSQGSSYMDPLIVADQPKKPLMPPASQQQQQRFAPPVMSTLTARSTGTSVASATCGISNSSQEQRHDDNGVNNKSDLPQSREPPASLSDPSAVPQDWNKKDVAQRELKEQETDLKAAKDMLENLQRKDEEQQTELHTANHVIATLQNELQDAKKNVDALQSKLSHTEDKLRTSNSECGGLRMTLGDIMDKHDHVQKQSASTFERLATLQISLDSMMEQQSFLTKAVTERNTNYQSITKKRQDLFEKLLAMDQDVETDESKLDAALQKQTREIEAIAAVIHAARDA